MAESSLDRKLDSMEVSDLPSGARTGPLTISPKWAVAREFACWAFGYEVTRWRLLLLMLLPLLLSGVFAAVAWPAWRPWMRPMTGRMAMIQLIWIALPMAGLGAVQYASKAVCWELSREMRDIVRLTDLSGVTLLWVKTLARWTMIGWSLLLMLPLVCFAFTLGNFGIDRLISTSCGLLLVAGLVGGISMLAGVLTSSSENPEKMAANSAGGIAVAYSMMFSAVSQSLYWGCYFITGKTAPVDELSSLIASWSPLSTLLLTINGPSFFTPLAPGYWIHLVAGGLFAATASFAAHVKWRSDNERSQHVGDEVHVPAARVQPKSQLVVATSVEASSLENATQPIPVFQAVPQQPVSHSKRPPCSDRPFFWKDVYILSDEGKWLNVWSMFYVMATFLLFMIYSFMALSTEFKEVSVFFAILTEILFGLIVSIRFDALLTAEFRDRTWGSLMLLPVDPIKLLFVKLQATLWEQRVAALPLGVSHLVLLIGNPIGLTYAGMGIVLGVVSCGLLCQMSSINQLLGKKWWVGPIQAVAFAILLGLSMLAFGVCPLVVGFALTMVLLTTTALVAHFAVVQPLARNWCEA
jgi:hypothetical protein